MENKERWTEEESEIFLRYGPYFIPGREAQQQILLDLLSDQPRLRGLVDLGCGGGRWCAAVLEHFPTARVTGLDGSEAMLAQTAVQCRPYTDRLTLGSFDLGAANWRRLETIDAFISSLVIHHLDADGKQALFRDLYRMLAPGGLLLIADIVLPTRPAGIRLAGVQWDKAVQRRLSGEPEGEKAFRLFKEDGWNFFDDPLADPIDQPSGLAEQLAWMTAAGFVAVDVFWMNAGHALWAGWKEEAEDPAI